MTSLIFIYKTSDRYNLYYYVYYLLFLGVGVGGAPSCPQWPPELFPEAPRGPAGARERGKGGGDP